MRWNWYHSTIKWSRRNAMEKNKEKWKKKKIRTRIRIAYVRSYCSLSDILARVLVIYFITDICMKRYCLYVDFLVPFFFLSINYFSFSFAFLVLSFSIIFILLLNIRHFMSSFVFSFLSSLCVTISLFFSTISQYFYELCARSDMHINAMKSLMWMIQKSSENKCLLNISSSLYTSVALSLAPLAQNEYFGRKPNCIMIVKSGLT